MENAGNSTPKYAIVQFDDMEFSVVPTIWLEEPNYCYWPQGIKNIRTAIVKGIPVQDTWNKYKCCIISKHVTYELALKAEKEAVTTSESENERLPGKRKIKSNKRNDYVDFVGPPKLVSSCKNSDNTNTAANDNLADLLANSLADPLADYNQNLELHNVGQNNGNVILNDNINNAPIIIAEGTDDLTSSINDIKEMINNIQLKIESMKNEHEQSLLLIQETTNMILAKINNEQYSREDTTVKDNMIRQHLPLTSIENLLEFEDILNDHEALMQVVNKVLLIGGKHEKDFVRRALAAIFTDTLASMCSWTGQKNNFKIGDTHVIMGIKKAFKTAFPRITEKNFEYLVMEWLRFANVRIQRKRN